MHTLNTQFRNDPLAFLRRFAIFTESEELHRLDQQPGIYAFDFDYSDGRQSNRVTLKRYERCCHYWVHWIIGSRRITAWWLPFAADDAPDLFLRAGADFFFTSHLSGCRVTVVPGVPQTQTPIRILHADGKARGSADPTGTHWRDRIVQRKLSASELSRARSLSTSGTGDFAYSFDEDSTFVAGFRHRARWQIWVQHLNEDGRIDLNPLYLEN